MAVSKFSTHKEEFGPWSDSVERKDDGVAAGPVALWECDLSDVRDYIEMVTMSGKTDFSHYFINVPQSASKCIERIKNVRIYRTTWELGNSDSTQPVLPTLCNVLCADKGELFIKAVSDLYRGKSSVSHALLLSHNGDKSAIEWTLEAQPGYEKTLGRVMVSISIKSAQSREAKVLSIDDAKLNAVIEITTVPAVIVDLQGCILRVNGYYANRMNIDVNTIIGKDWYSMLGKESANSCRKEIEKAVFFKSPGKCYANDEHGSLQCFIFPVADEGEAVNKLVIFANDVTRRNRMENAMNNIIDRFVNSIESAGMIYAVILPDEKLGYLNKIGCEMMGMNEGKASGLNWFETFIDDENRARFKQIFRDCLAGKETDAYYAPIAAGNGEMRCIKWVFTRVMDSADVKGQKIIGVMLLGDDITDFIMADRKLDHIKKKHHEQLTHSSDLLCTVDRDLKVTYISPAIEKQFGLSSKKFLGICVRELEILMTCEADPLMQMLGRVLKEGNLESGKSQFLLSDGSTGYFEYTAYPDQMDGKIVGITIIGRNITESVIAEERIRKMYLRQKAITDINEALLRIEEPVLQYRRICEVLTSLDFAELCWIGSLNEKEQTIKILAYGGIPTRGCHENVFPINAYPENEAVTAGKTIVDNDYDVEMWASKWAGSLDCLPRTISAYASVPLVLDGLVVGVVSVYSVQKNIFTNEVLEFMEEVAGNIAVGIRTHRMQKELKKGNASLQKYVDSTVNAIISITEKRDPYTAGHQRRVAKLACAIASEMGMAEEKISELKLASMLHDIGKISIPSDILSKPGKLTAAEFNYIKTHARASYDILKDTEFPPSVALIVLQHHERLDGTGYPDGLQGDQISKESRILAVADVIEAISSHRPYRPSLGIEYALKEISAMSGIMYGSDAVEICNKLFLEKGFQFD